MEQWRRVAGFEGYEVSDHGRIRSYRSRNGRGPFVSIPRILKAKTNRDGHQVLTLRRGLKDISVHVHRLVMLSFDPFNGQFLDRMLVRHLDGNPANNHISNLQWGTHSENLMDRYRHAQERNPYE